MEERDAVLEQQENTVKRVLNSNLDLTEEYVSKHLSDSRSETLGPCACRNNTELRLVWELSSV